MYTHIAKTTAVVLNTVMPTLINPQACLYLSTIYLHFEAAHGKNTHAEYQWQVYTSTL